jgi:sugar/nucleoside kinase (ribokinase family)
VGVNPFVAVYGHMHVDVLFDLDAMPPLGSEVVANNLAIAIGGGPIVYPYNLDRLDVPSVLGTVLEDDFGSRMARDLLAQLEYRNIREYRIGAPNPVVVTGVFTSPTHRSYVSFPAVRESPLDAEQLLDLIGNCAVTMCPHDVDLAQELRRRGVRLIVDSSVNGGLTMDEYIDLLPLVEFFTPSDFEAVAICDEPNVLRCLDILGEELEHPVITMGERGLLVKSDNRYLHLPPVPGISSVDTTGAGDNFVSGLMYGMYHEFDLVTTLTYGSVFGALSTEVYGCLRRDFNAALVAETYARHLEPREIQTMADIA